MRFKGFRNSKLLTSKLKSNDEEQVRFKGFYNLKLLKSILRNNDEEEISMTKYKVPSEYKGTIESIFNRSIKDTKNGYCIIPGLYMAKKVDKRIKDAVKH